MQLHLASRRQRGLAAFTVVLLLVGVALIAVAYAARTLVAEQRAAAAQLRASQSFAAAQAGIEWAVMQLNRAEPVDATCAGVSALVGSGLRARLLTEDADSGSIVPVARPGVVGCNLGPGGAWACDCAGDAASALPPPPNEPTPGFRVQLAATAPGSVQLTAVGCADVHDGCPGTRGVSRVSVLLGALPAIKSPPAAPLLARGDLQLGSAVALTNLDPSSGGLLAAAAGTIHGAPGATSTLAGMGTTAALRSQHGMLRALDAARTVRRHLGLDETRWSALPSVAHVACGVGDCSAPLRAALDGGARMLRIDGDLEIDAAALPFELGSAAQPVTLLVTGGARWRGAVRVHGVVAAADLQWAGAGAARGGVRGALLVDGDADLQAAADLHYDADVLRRLTRRGALVPLAGSWRDF